MPLNIKINVMKGTFLFGKQGLHIIICYIWPALELLGFFIVYCMINYYLTGLNFKSIENRFFSLFLGGGRTESDEQDTKASFVLWFNQNPHEKVIGKQKEWNASIAEAEEGKCSLFSTMLWKNKQWLLSQMTQVQSQRLQGIQVTTHFYPKNIVLYFNVF